MSTTSIAATPAPFEQEPQLCGVYRLQAGCRSLHSRDDRVELTFITGGSGTHIVGGEKCESHIGDVVIYDSSVLHDEMDSAQPMSAWCIAVKNLKLPGQRVNALTPAGVRPIVQSREAAATLSALYPMVYQYAREPGGYQTANALARSIVLIVYEELARSAAPATPHDNGIVRTLEEYIEQHYTEPISLAELAGTLNANRFYLSHLFREVTGYTLQQYILRRRIGEAQRLLTASDERLTTISGRVGFEDPNYFSRAFKKIIGLPPVAYRQRWREMAIEKCS